MQYDNIMPEDEALDLTATSLRHLAETYGPETVAFSNATHAETSISDARTWIFRLRQTFGSPNNCNALELCGWHRIAAAESTFGVERAVPELQHSGCGCSGGIIRVPPC
jgi:hypothetical protein